MISSDSQKMQKIIAIVGPTSIGKTSLSIEMAKMLDTEVVSADSRQVYKGINISSGKVTKEEMDGVPHHLLDVADPKDVFTASDYLKLGKEALQEVFNKGKVPIVIGGTGFYIDVLLEKIMLPNVPANKALREQLGRLSLEELQNELKQVDSKRFKSIDVNNPRRIIRAIEIAKALGKNPQPTSKSPYEILWIGLELPLDEVRIKIKERMEDRLKNGMVDEIKTLHTNGLSYERLEELGLDCRYVAKHLQGEITYDEMFESLIIENGKYARRQMTWFKDNKEIHWFSPEEKGTALELAKNFVS